MRSIYYILFIILSISLFYSCGDSFTQTLDIDEPEFKSQMTFFTRSTLGDTLVEYLVGRNVGIIQSGPETNYFLQDAELSILRLPAGPRFNFKEHGVWNGSGYYTLQGLQKDFFQEGQKYRYELSHPEFTNSITELTFPKLGSITNIEYKFEGGLDEEGDEASSINFDILDLAAEENYYELELLKYNHENDLMPHSIWIFTIDPTAIKAIPDDHLFFSDESFDGEAKNIEIKFDRWNYDPDSGARLELRWRSINKGYYDYVKTLSRFSDTQDTPFISPVQVSSNVNDALGAIGLRAEIVYEIPK